MRGVGRWAIGTEHSLGSVVAGVHWKPRHRRRGRGTVRNKGRRWVGGLRQGWNGTRVNSADSAGRDPAQRDNRNVDAGSWNDGTSVGQDRGRKGAAVGQGDTHARTCDAAVHNLAEAAEDLVQAFFPRLERESKKKSTFTFVDHVVRGTSRNLRHTQCCRRRPRPTLVEGLGSTTTMREGQTHTCNNSKACREGTRYCMQRGERCRTRRRCSTVRTH